MADGILAAVNENGNIDRFIDTKGGVHYIEPKRYEESVAKIDAAATKAKETVNSATEAVSECKAQTGACTQETARAKEIADTVESRITGIEGDVAALRDSVSQIVERGKSGIWTYTKYADGTAECYGTTKHSLTRTGNFWLPEINLPFTMVKPANSYNDFTVIISGGANFSSRLYPDYPVDKASVNAVKCAVENATDRGDIPVNYIVRGRWK